MIPRICSISFFWSLFPTCMSYCRESKVSRLWHSMSWCGMHLFLVLALLMRSGVSFRGHAIHLHFIASVTLPLHRAQAWSQEPKKLVRSSIVLWTRTKSSLDLLGARDGNIFYLKEDLVDSRSHHRNRNIYPTHYDWLHQLNNLIMHNNLQELDDNTMMRIIRKHSWLLYLDVETNLRPTVETLHQNGFTPNDIRMMVAKVQQLSSIKMCITSHTHLYSIPSSFDYLN